jgi:hypothetical protein
MAAEYGLKIILMELEQRLHSVYPLQANNERGHICRRWVVIGAHHLI